MRGVVDEDGELGAAPVGHPFVGGDADDPAALLREDRHVVVAVRAGQPVDLVVDPAAPGAQEAAVQVLVAGPPVQGGEVGPVGRCHRPDPDDGTVGGEGVMLHADSMVIGGRAAQC